MGKRVQTFVARASARHKSNKRQQDAKQTMNRLTRRLGGGKQR